MIKSLDDVQQFGNGNMDAAVKSFGVVSKGFQAITVELADYSKKSFEDGTQALQKLLAVKSFDKAFEVQQSYIKDAYEGFASKATKLGELYADLAKEICKPFDGHFKKMTPTK